MKPGLILSTVALAHARTGRRGTVSVYAWSGEQATAQVKAAVARKAIEWGVPQDEIQATVSPVNQRRTR